MSMDTLQDLFVDELKDAYSAERQVIATLPKMAKAAKSPKLKQGFRKHERQSRQHVKRIEQICRRLGVSPKGKKCKGMEGLLKEGQEIAKEKGSPAVIDAALIAAAQRVEHYEIAAYGCLRNYARLMGHAQAVKMLQQTLNEEADTDRSLTVLAEQEVNNDAAIAGWE